MGRSFGNFESGESPEEVDRSSEVPEDDNEFDSKFDEKWDDKENSEEARESGPKIVVNEDGTKRLKCKNEELDGKTHEKTGVPFEKKEVTVNGEKVDGVFPQFESKYDTKLPEDMYKEGDTKQFKYCTEQLKKDIEKNPELAKQFNPRQLEQIKNEEPRISGYTWHHTENPGEMKLVDAKTHHDTGHTGGRSIWGGGTDSR